MAFSIFFGLCFKLYNDISRDTVNVVEIAFRHIGMTLTPGIETIIDGGGGIW